ncbi:MAG TPA: sulfite exporter TauE/SafE family protein [Candidatus Dormibacteraeota bacterium]|nr:sulfite exporter TauE/SafE family protein [Candidatus Dormibacteraeota bacterium]
MIFLAWVAAGIAVGAYGTLVGAGGGFALVPILLLVYPRQSAAQLTAVSLAVVFANVVSGSISYARLRRIDYRTGLILAPATIPGAVIGALVVGAIPRVAFDAVMGSALILVAVFLLLKPSGSVPVGLNGPWVVSRTLIDSDGNRYAYRFNQTLAVLASFGIGFVSSLLGIGGGIVQVPILTTFFGFPAHIASATSQFVQVATSGVGAVTHIVHGDYAGFVGVTIALAIGVIIGAQAGASISRRVAGSSIIRLLAVALGLVGIRLLLLR